MIAIDTNILVYAHREDSPWHEAANRQVKDLSEGNRSWAIPWPCLYEFLAIVTHPRIYNPPSPLEMAVTQVEAWLESPGVVLISEGESFWTTMKRVIQNGKVTGPRVHDARIAALCISHGVKYLWTADRDFSRFPELSTHNPLI